MNTNDDLSRDSTPLDASLRLQLRGLRRELAPERDLRLQLDRDITAAQTRVEAARVRHNRAEQLLRDKAGSEKAVQQIENGFRMGAAGLKEYKRLGLNLRNRAGELIKIDDPKLDPVWAKCGELGMPVSIHVADPRA